MYLDFNCTHLVYSKLFSLQSSFLLFSNPIKLYYSWNGKKKGSEQNYATRHPLNLNWTLFLSLGILIFKWILHKSKILHTQTGPALSVSWPFLLWVSPKQPSWDCFPKPHAASQQDPPGPHSCSQRGLGPLLPPAEMGMSVGYPQILSLSCTRSRAQRGMNVHTSRQLQGHLCSHCSLCLSAAPLGPPPHLSFHRINHTTKFTMRQAGTCHGAASTALGVSVSAGASEPHMSQRLLQYHNSYFITFKHQISLGVFFKNGPLVISTTVTAETNQMELDRPQHQTSARQSS